MLHDLLSQADSATAVLDRLCGRPVFIRRLATICPPAPTQLAHTPILHRRVELVCGETALSQADLWYRPALLTADMVDALAATETPFGRVVGALGLRRQVLQARVCAPGEAHALEHRALLVSRSGEPVAEVHERYSWALVGAGGS